MNRIVEDSAVKDLSYALPLHPGQSCSSCLKVCYGQGTSIHLWAFRFPAGAESQQQEGMVRREQGSLRRRRARPAARLHRRASTEAARNQPYLVADPKPTGGSMFRIYRDTRFSKNKEPYKTMASAFFSHQTGGKEGPGLYLHLEPDSCFMGAGLYHPDPVSRTKVTDAIAAKPDVWRDATSGKEFRKLLKMEG